MKKLYCYMQTEFGWDVFEYTQKGEFIFHRNYKAESEAAEAIKKLSC